MNLRTALLSLLLAPVVFSSCKKEAASDSQTSDNASSFSYELTTVNRTSSVARTEAGSIQWTAGTANPTQIKFEATNSSGEIEFKQATSTPIDLFNASSSLGALTVPAGTYTEVEFKAQLVPAGNTPALELSGTFTSGTTTKPVVFRVGSNLELKAEKANVVVAAGTTYSAVNAIDLSGIAEGISATSLSNATLTNGTIVISSSSNSGLYATLLNNLSRHHGEAEIHHH